MKAGQLVAFLLAAGALVLGAVVLSPGGADAPSEPGELARDSVGEKAGELERAPRVHGEEGGEAAGRSRPGGEAEQPGGLARTAMSGSSGVRAQLFQQQQPLPGAKVWLERDGKRFPPEGEGVRSDDRGAVALEGMPAGDYRLRVEHEEVPRSWRGPSVPLVAGEVADLGRLDLPQAGGVRGRLVNEQQTPLAGTRVFLRRGVLGGLLRLAPGSDDGVETDAQGRFEVTRLAAATWVVACDHPGYRRLEKRVEIAPGRYVDVGTLELARGRELAGIVADDKGTGIEGASVSYEHTSRFGSDEARYYARRRAVRTDAGGRFRLAGLPERVKLKATAPGFAPLRGFSVPDEAVTVRLTLECRRGVAGIVRNAEDRKVEVWLMGTTRRGPAGELISPSRRRETADEEGRFFFADVKPGTYTVLAESADYGASDPRRIRVRPERGVDDLELVLREGPSLEVAVTDPKGAAIEGARVRLRIQEGTRISDQDVMDWLETPQRLAMTGAEGKAVLRGAWAGRGVLDVTHPGYLPAIREKLALRPGVNRVTMQLEPGGWVAGKCIDTRGTPLEGIEVSVGPEPTGGDVHVRRRIVRRGPGGEDARVFSASKRVKSGKDGTFRAGPMRPGNYLVKASRDAAGMTFESEGASIRFDGQAQSDAEAKTRIIAGETSSVVLRLTRPGSLSGIVRYEGSPVGGARVFARRKPTTADAPVTSMFGGKRTKSDAGGHYAFPELSAGTWLVSVKPPRGPIATRPLEVVVPEGAPASQDLELGGGQIRGVLRRAAPDPRGYAELKVRLRDPTQPMEQRRIAIALAGNDGDINSTSMSMNAPGAPEPVGVGKNGAFRVVFVPAGTWTVQVRGTDSVVLWTKEVEVADNQAVDLGTIELAPVFPVQLKILAPSGDPVQFGNVEVAKLDPNGEPGESVFRGLARNGSCKIKGLAPGKYRVTFRAIQIGRAGEKAEPQSGELVVGADGSVTGSRLELKR